MSLPNRPTCGQPFWEWLGSEFSFVFGALHPLCLSYPYKYKYIIRGMAQQVAAGLRSLQKKFGHLLWANVRHRPDIATKYLAQPPKKGWALPIHLGHGAVA